MTVRLGRGEDVYEALKVRSLGDGSAAGLALNIQEVDGTPSVNDVNTIIVPNGTLTDESGGAVTLTNYDANAIHDNESGEISVITEKTEPIVDDLLVIEDSAASNAKKRIKIGNLPGGSTTYHKIYVALLNQSGTSAPVADVKANELGHDVTWTRSSAGQYAATLDDSAFPDDTIIFVGTTKSISTHSLYSFVMAAINPAGHQVDLVSARVSIDAGHADVVQADSLLENTAIEIRLYSPNYPPAESVYFVDATGGDDDNDGLSSTSPWQTIGKVNSATLVAGDHVLFKRGETFTDAILRVTGINGDRQGAVGNHIVYDAYGTGDKPIFTPGGGLTVAIYASSSGTSAGYITLRNLDACGDGVNTNIAGQFLAKHFIIEDCVFRNALTDGVQLSAGSTDVTFTDCLAHDNAGKGLTGGLATGLVHGCTAYDNGTSVTGDHGIYFRGSDIVIDHCTCYGNSGGGFKFNVADDCTIRYSKAYSNGTGLFLGTEADTSSSGHSIYNNDFSNNTNSGIQFNNSGSGINKCTFYHNTIANNGASVGGCAEIYFYEAGSACNVFKNNIIYGDNDLVGSGSWPVRFANEATMLAQTFNYNCVYRKGSTAIMYDGASHTWAEYQAHGHEANGVNSDPVFAVNYSNLHLQTTSPAKNTGASGLGITDDYDGVTRDATPDMGAYEYV